jgi:Ca2+-binding EF-hand superfamily protein
MNRILLVLPCVLACMGGPAWSQAPATAPQPLDANRDGVLERSEAAANPSLAAQFDTLDRNHDGRLDRSELPPRKAAGARPPSLDTDGDGRISRSEAAADTRLAGNFARLDLSGDGFLDDADRRLADQRRRDAWFKAADTDGNGAISRAEFDADYARGRAAPAK